MLRRTLALSPAFLICVASQVHGEQEPKFADRTRSEWLKILKEDKSARLREGAVAALSLMEPRDRVMVDAVADALINDKAERVRLRAVEGVGAILRTSNREEPALVDALGKSLSTEPVEAIRLKVTEQVKELKKDYLRRLAPTLAEVLRSDKLAPVRVAVAGALSRAGEYAASVINSMIEILKDPEPSVRSAVAEALGRIGFEAKGAVPAIKVLLKDPEASVRLASAFALGRIGLEAASAIPELSQSLATDTDVSVRKESARAFALMGLDAKSAIPALAKSLKEDKSEEVRRQAALALGKMPGETAGVAAGMVEVLRSDTDKTVRIYVAHALGDSLGDGLRVYVKELADQLTRDNEGDVRLAIVQQLGALGPAAKEALPALNRAAADVQLSVREEAKKAIKKVQAQ